MSYFDEINKLINAQDFESLIDRFVNPPFPSLEQAELKFQQLLQADDDEYPGDNSEYIKKLNDEIQGHKKVKDFLSDHIKQVIQYLEEENPTKRYNTVLALGELMHRDSIASLIKQLTKEQDKDITDKLLEILIQPSDKEDTEKNGLWIEWGNYRKHLLNALRNTKGSRLSYFYKIAANIKDRDTRYRILELLGTRFCNIKGGECDKDLVTCLGTYFIGYDFNKPEVRELIKNYFQNRYPSFKPLLPEDEYLNGIILCNICKKIQTAQFCIFDLSDDLRFLESIISKEPNHNLALKFDTVIPPNHNVMLELGMALVLGRPSIILCKQGTKIITDLKGLLYVPYKEISEIPQILSKKDLSKIIGNIPDKC